jgi:hypothetical protein
MRIPASVPALAVAIALTWGAGPGAGSGLGRSGATNVVRPTITLRVVNEGGVDPQPLVLAKKEATRIFDHSGIGLVWLDCQSGRAEWANGNPCQRDLGPAEFWMRVVTHRPSATSQDMLGFTELDESRGSGSAGVYYTAAVEMASMWPARVGEILGAAIAHEVGHLILGANAHAPRGVMYAHWGRAQFELIGISELSFPADQAKLLRDGIERRRQMAVAAAR